ncbi:MAG: hypothetical protein M5U14_08325 [Acidimicrobiia bacterium]|nr:hypothetical protein [Acidimicrobiia bacterium]
MTARRAANLILTAGLVLGVLAYSAFATRRTVFDVDRLTAAAAGILEAAPVQDLLGDQVAEQIAEALPSDAVHDGTVVSAARETLRDPRFVEAFTEAMTALYQRVFAGAEGPVVLDLSATTDSVRSALARGDSSLADYIGYDDPITVRIGEGDLPDLQAWKGRLGAFTVVGALLGLSLVIGGVVLHPHRSQAVGRVGRWLAGYGCLQLVVFWLFPAAVLPAFAEWGKVMAEVIRGTGSTLVAPAVVAGVAGAALMGAAYAWQRRQPVVTEHLPGRPIAAAPTPLVSRVGAAGRWEPPV